MSDTDKQLSWTRPDFLADAHGWIHEQLGRLGRPVIGPIEQPHVRPWSTVLRAPTAGGPVLFKAGAAGFAHEPATLLVIARRCAGCVPRPLATDIECGWMLLNDLCSSRNGERRLREILQADRDLGHWEKLLPAYAELQISVAGQTSELLALGAPDHHPAALPARFEYLLADTSLDLSPDERADLCVLAPRLAALCTELEAGPVSAATLDHGDLHDGNIFVHDGGRYVFFDWGDCTITHPFFGLRTVLVSVENTLGLDENAPELERLRNAYLEPWLGTRGANRNDLCDTLDLALRVAPVSRALTWHRAVSTVPAPFRDEYAPAVPALLRKFLEGEGRVL